jgi:Holliday junction resolvase
MGKMQRDKGKIGEREVANLLKEHGFDARRGQQFKGTPDSPDVVGFPGHHVEVKRVEALNVSAAFKRVKADASEFEIPIVFHRKSREQWLVTLAAEDYLKGRASDDLA